MLRKTFLLTMTTIAILGLAACSSGPAPIQLKAENAVPSVSISEEMIELQNEALSASTVASTSPDEKTVAGETGATSIDSVSLDAAQTASLTTALSAEEAAGLAYMREEEKLAHDVYLYLYGVWGSQIFQNIAASEQTHTDSIKTLLERYDLADPSAGKTAGQFADPVLQGLYDQLTSQGSQSLADAFKVGAAIEEIDILDLQERLAQTAHADIQLVYQNLEKGSRNHLRSFVNTLENRVGEAYQPQYMDLESYQAIISSPIESGGPGQGGNGSGGNGFGGNGAGGNQP